MENLNNMMMGIKKTVDTIASSVETFKNSNFQKKGSVNNRRDSGLNRVPDSPANIIAGLPGLLGLTIPKANSGGIIENNKGLQDKLIKELDDVENMVDRRIKSLETSISNQLAQVFTTVKQYNNEAMHKLTTVERKLEEYHDFTF